MALTEAGQPPATGDLHTLVVRRESVFHIGNAELISGEYMASAPSRGPTGQARVLTALCKNNRKVSIFCAAARRRRPEATPAPARR